MSTQIPMADLAAMQAWATALMATRPADFIIVELNLGKARVRSW